MEDLADMQTDRAFDVCALCKRDGPNADWHFHFRKSDDEEGSELEFDWESSQMHRGQHHTCMNHSSDVCFS